MRVLWVCNIMPPVVGQYLGKECSVKEGWISGILARLAKEKEEIELGICYPVTDVTEETRADIPLDNKNIILDNKYIILHITRNDRRSKKCCRQ